MNDKIYAIILMFMSAVFYTIASYFHLEFEDKNWNITKALLIAMPIVFLEYNCSLRGIRLAHNNGFTSNQIFLIIVCFCFACLFILNKFILGDRTTVYDIIAFLLLIVVFCLSYPDILHIFTKKEIINK